MNSRALLRTHSHLYMHFDLYRISRGRFHFLQTIRRVKFFFIDDKWFYQIFFFLLLYIELSIATQQMIFIKNVVYVWKYFSILDPKTNSSDAPNNYLLTNPKCSFFLLYFICIKVLEDQLLLRNLDSPYYDL